MQPNLFLSGRTRISAGLKKSQVRLAGAGRLLLVNRKVSLVLLFLLHVLPFLSRPTLVGGDEVHYALMTHSIAMDGDFDLRNDYADVAKGSSAAGRKRAGENLDQHIRLVAGIPLSIHPVGVPLLLAPLLRLQEALAPGHAPDLVLVGSTLVVTFVALISGWRCLGAYTGDQTLAGIWVFGGFFASPLWFYSRTLFTEPFTWSLAVLAVSAIWKRRYLVASALLGMTLLTKETAALLVIPILIGCYILIGLRRTVPLLVGPVLAVLFYLGKNLVFRLPLLTTSQDFSAGNILAGATGLLVDARHGLLPFAPLLALGAALGGFVLARNGRDRSTPVPAVVALAAFGGYFALSAAWSDWRGGSCYGPRLVVPAIPALIVLAFHTPLRAKATRIALGASFVAGFTVSWCAALAPWRAFWGATPLELLQARPLGAVVGAILAILIVASCRSITRGVLET